MNPYSVVADENIALATVAALRSQGIDVDSIATIMPGATDETVLRHAVSRYAVLVTFDRDYGELIYERGRPAPLSVLYLRAIPSSPSELTEILIGLLTGKTAGDISGYLVVWARDGIRKRAFPGRSHGK